MSNIELKPITLGVYSHWKKGHKYVVYDTVMDEAEMVQLVSYYRLEEPDKRWSRRLDVFFGEAPQTEENETGQAYKFEFVSAFVERLTRGMIPSDEPYITRSVMPISDHLQDAVSIGDNIRYRNEGKGNIGTVVILTEYSVSVRTPIGKLVSLMWKDVIAVIRKVEYNKQEIDYSR